MRKSVSIALGLLAILTLVTGVAALPSGSAGGDAGSSGLHILISFLFVIVSAVHIWLNRQPIKKYLAGLGWKWAFITIPAVIITAAPFIDF